MKFILSMIVSSVFILNTYAKEPFIWYDDEDYRPYIYKNANGEPEGLFKEIMIEAFKRMDIPLKYEVYSWKRTQKYVKDAKADGMVTVYTKKRSEFLIHTNPLLVAHAKIFARSDNPQIKKIMKIKKISEFKDYKVIDYIGAGWAEESYKGLDIIWVPQNTNAFLMLANKRADIYVAGEFIGINNIQTLIRDKPQYATNLKKLIYGKFSFVDMDFDLLIRKDSKYAYIVPIFNKTLNKMKLDGTYSHILNKYLKL
jgi:polar amino acid transport system substrate-binding protein